MKTPPLPQPSSLPDDPLDDAVYQYLLCTGKIIPRAAEDVARAEARLTARPVPLPPEFLQASTPFSTCATSKDRITPRVLRKIPAVEAALGQAAREGKEITPEVADRMERDRAEAERKATGE